MTQFPQPPPLPPQNSGTPPPMPPNPPPAGYGSPPYGAQPYPQQPYQQPGPPMSEEVLGGLIPVNNPNALLSYYIGIFAFIPMIGIVLGIAAVVLGIKALKFAAQYPMVKGKTHAWVGILCGGFFGLLWLALTALVIIASLSSSHSSSY